MALPAGAPVIVAGNEHACAILPDRSVYCWGRNSWGQVGSGTFTHAPSPVAVSDLEGVLTLWTGLGA
ncbi:MAG: hypothetical protein HYY13_12095 [Nitrospirae bacterium]|nr:hypothetical protein [Nitrospirota bacterium]